MHATMKLSTIFIAALAPFSASARMFRARHMEAIEAASFNIPGIDSERSLQGIEDLQYIRIGDEDSTIEVVINETKAGGLVTYGDALLAIGPPVRGGLSEVTCYATLTASDVDMRFYLRKAIAPDEDGDGTASEFDCEASSDTDLMSPDEESCSVTNFEPLGDIVIGYVAVVDDALQPLGSKYNVAFRCDLTSSDPLNSCACFSEDTTVEVLGKGTVKMADLAIGDLIYTGESYEPVYAFAHLDKTKSASYLHISTDSPNAPLEISEDHLVYANGKYTAAKDIKAGDKLMEGSHGEAKVQKITTQEKTGLYAPLTPSGTLLVNGIQTSAYVSLQKDARDTLRLGDKDTHLSFHTLNHMALSPIRMACMGISSTFCSTEYINEENGYPPFVSLWLDLVQWFELQVLPLQVFILALFFSIVGPIFMVESILGATYGPMLFLIGAPALLYQYSRQQCNCGKVKQL